MHKFLGFIVFTALAIVLSGCSFSLSEDITPPPGSEQGAPQQTPGSIAASAVYPILPPDLSNGLIIYNQECAKCHGVQGLGDGPQAVQLSVPAATLGLSDFARLDSPADWYAIVTHGNPDHYMPAFSDLTDRQRWDVVAYAMNISVQDKLVAQGEALYSDNCTSCHGQTGHGNGPDAASLSTSPTNFTDQSVMAQSSANELFQAISNGTSPDMPAFSNALDENERWALVAYLRSMTYAIQEASQLTNPTPALATSADTYPGPEPYPAPLATQSVLLDPTAEISPTAPITGSVSVQIINGSGGDTPSDVPVTLYGFDDMQQTYTETLTAGVNGIYTFSNVAMPEGRVFIAGAQYDSGTFPSEIVTVDPTTPDLNLQINVYETTTDTSVLTTDRVHILFDFSTPQIAQVVEVYIISNPSKQAVISASPDGKVVSFPLPQGYSNLQFQDGEIGGRYVDVEQGFADTSTVTPGVGAYTVIYSFELPYNHKLDFSQLISLPTSAVVVLLPENGVKVVSDQLQDGGTLNSQGLTYHKYNGSGLLSGSQLEFTLSGNPTSAGTTIFSAGTGQSLAIGLGVFGLALLAAGLWLYRRNQTRLALQASSEGVYMGESGSTFEATAEDEDTLMDAIIALDDQYNAGNLPEEAYLERRAVLKAKLRNLDHG